ncbi:MAG TPA: hypothetical protein VH855_25670 [Acetobacteraceae bacterium]
MTTSRRSLFALLGLVLPVAAFTASPAAAATSSSLHSKSHVRHASHKSSPRHTGSVHHVSHRTSHHPAKPTAS